MPYGISIHVGLDYVDRRSYGLTTPLPFCSNDAKEMQSLADKCGFTSQLLIDKQATTIEFLYFLDKAALFLSAGDILFISFSGHGSQRQDLNGDEEDRTDETLCFFDRQLLDDELFQRWQKFRVGVRILFIADCCHSGTVTKDFLYLPNSHGSPEIPFDISNRSTINSSVLLISACKDSQVTSGIAKRGKSLSNFTAELLECWNNGFFSGSYTSLFKLLKARLKYPSPNYYFIGKPNSAFENQKPFTI